MFTPNKMSMTSQPVTEIDGTLAPGKTTCTVCEKMYDSQASMLNSGKKGHSVNAVSGEKCV